MLGGKVARRAAVRVPGTHAHDRSAADAAWLAAIPCTVTLLAALLLLGPPLRDALTAATPHISLLPEDPGRLAPEQRETASYLIALCGPLLLALATVALRRTRRWPAPRARSLAVAGAQLLMVAFLVACFAAQHTGAWRLAYFTVPTLAAAVALAVALALAARRVPPRRRARSGVRGRDATLLAVAALLAAVWLLPGINTEHSITWATFHYDTAFPFDETFAVVDHLTPLATFDAQYASLLPYVLALPMVAFGKTLLVFTIAICALSALALLALYDVLRRAGGSAPIALALFVPLLATALFDPYGIPGRRYTAGMYFGMLPLRYFGPYVLAWLVARRLGSARGARAWPLFAAAGVVVLNNVDFGVAALGATLGALLVAGVRSRRALSRLVVDAAAGLLVAVGLVAALTLARAGSLPDFADLARYSRLYGLAGYSVARMPAILGLPLVVYLTYVAAIGTSVVRALDGAPNRVLTGLLAWSGVFGLGSASYWVARSAPSLLAMTLSAWALAVALLALAVREAARGSRRVGLPGLAVLFALGLTACSIAQVPAPWSEIARVGAPPPGIQPDPPSWSPPPTQAPAVRQFIASTLERGGRYVVRPGAPVALLATIGHRVADAYGVVDVVPFTGAESMHTLGEFEAVLDRLRHDGGDTVLLEAERVGALHAALERHGFRLLTQEGVRSRPVEDGGAPPEALVVEGLTKWVDAARAGGHA